MPDMMDQCRQLFDRVFAVYRFAGCPCAFPRFRQLVAFNFRNFARAPVGCHLTETAIALACSPTSFYTRGGRDLCCRVCAGEILYHDEEFSIAMRFARLEFSTIKATQVGASAAEKVPMPRGFFGFREPDIAACARGFTREAPFRDLERYLTERADMRQRVAATCPLAGRDS